MSTFYDTATAREVLSLRVTCTHADKSCNWTGELRQLEVHIHNLKRKHHLLNLCSYFSPFFFCKQTHLSKCALVEASCPNGCQEALTRGTLDEHLRVCSTRAYSSTLFFDMCTCCTSLPLTSTSTTTAIATLMTSNSSREMTHIVHWGIQLPQCVRACVDCGRVSFMLTQRTLPLPASTDTRFMSPCIAAKDATIVVVTSQSGALCTVSVSTQRFRTGTLFSTDCIRSPEPGVILIDIQSESDEISDKSKQDKSAAVTWTTVSSPSGSNLTAASSATRVIVTSADLLPPKITQVPQTPTNNSNDSHNCEIHTLETKLALVSVSNPRAGSILVNVKTHTHQGDMMSFENDFFPTQ